MFTKNCFKVYIPLSFTDFLIKLSYLCSGLMFICFSLKPNIWILSEVLITWHLRPSPLVSETQLLCTNHPHFKANGDLLHFSCFNSVWVSSPFPSFQLLFFPHILWSVSIFHSFLYSFMILPPHTHTHLLALSK